jgi:single-strand DNA-binding protein
MSDVLVGNLVADPELRFTPNGVALTKARVAVTTRIKVGEKWQDGETSFHDLTIWRGQAERAADFLHKGDRVVAVGRWTTREWNGDDGDRHESREFQAEDIGLSLKFGRRD